MKEIILKKIAEAVFKFSFKKLEKSQKVIRVLKLFGLEKLEDNFDSIYLNTLVEYGLDNKPEVFIDVFAESSVKLMFCNFTKDSSNKEPLIREGQRFIKLKNQETLIGNTEIEIDYFISIYQRLVNQIQTPAQLQLLNELRELKAQGLEKTYEYQIDYYLTKTDDELKNDLEKIKYIDLTGTIKIKTHEKKEALDFTIALKSLGLIKEDKEELRMFNPVDVFVNQWLNNNSQRFLLMLGEYGTGKTSFCKHLTHVLTNNYLTYKKHNYINDGKKRIPLLFNLSYFKAEDISDFVISQLNKKGIQDINFAQFEDKIRKGEFVLIFDGFDEMTQNIDEDQKRKNFYQLQKLIEISPESKIILTSRIEYFHSDEELKRVIKNLEETNSSLIQVDTFSEYQIKEYLKEQVSDPDYYWEKINSVIGLKEISQRAVLLNFVIQYLPAVLKIKPDNEPLKATDFYKVCFDKEFERKEKEVPDLNSKVRSQSRMQLLEELALWMFFHDSLSIEVKLVKEVLDLKTFFHTEVDWEITKYLNAFLTFSFLTKERDYVFKISHKSFRDYLVAKSFEEEISKNKIKNLGRQKCSDEIIQFIFELSPSKENLLSIIKEVKDFTKETEWLGNNIIRLLLLFGADSLDGQNFSKLSIKEINFTKFNLVNTKLRNTKLYNCILNKNVLDCVVNEADCSNSKFTIRNGIINRTDLAKLYKMKGLSSVVLIDCKLKTFPHVISELKNLTKLDLSSNQLTTLPKEISELKNLTTLYLYSNQLTTLPKEISELKNLTVLDLNLNQLTTLPKEISELKNLTKLDLRFNQLTTLPKEISKLKNLTKLDLRSNKLTTIPKEISELKNLTMLDLSSNKLTTIPKEISELKNLTTLYLYSNQLTTLPKETSELKNLTTFSLSSSQLTIVPHEISELKNLTTLFLYSNQLTTLPPEISELKNLTKLYLDSNQLTTFPHEISELKNLTMLNLSSNQLTIIPREISELKNLTALYLDSNQLTTLPHEIGELKNLTELKLSNSRLTTLPHEISELKNLTMLDLSSNQLTTLPHEIIELKNLTMLDLSSNQLTTLPHEISELKNLTKLDLHSNQLTTLPEEISKLEKLDELNLHSNHLKDIPKELIKLTRVKISVNKEQLNEMPQWFREMSNIIQTQ